MNLAPLSSRFSFRSQLRSMLLTVVVIMSFANMYQLCAQQLVGNPAKQLTTASRKEQIIPARKDGIGGGYAAVQFDRLIAESSSSQTKFARLIAEVKPKIDELSSLPDGAEKERLRTQLRNYVVDSQKRWDAPDKAAVQKLLRRYCRIHHITTVIDTSKLWPDGPIFWVNPRLDITDDLQKELDNLSEVNHE
jgi:hypothetical protein